MAMESTAAHEAARNRTPESRTREARALLERALQEPVELIILSGMELCVLGAPKQVLCEEKLATTWLGYSDRRRRKAMDVTTESLVSRGLLLAEADRGPQAADADSDTYALDPALGLMLAARSRPAFVVVTAIGTAEARTPRMYGIGDEEVPVRAVVVELPQTRPPGDFPHLAALGALGRLYRYVLVSVDTAADWLAEWADKPAPEQLRTADGLPARLVSVYRHDEGSDFRGFTVALRHEGGRAQLLVDGAADGDTAGEYDADGVRRIMRDLLVLGRR
jgi:hypothetical protein